MRCGWHWLFVGCCLATGLTAGKAPADWCCWPHHTADIGYGTTTEADHTAERAGYPQEISCIAHPVETCAYVGYPVGGGAPCHGSGPCHGDYPAPTDGTWGWDYQGRCFKRHVFLWFWHGRRYQDGLNGYKIDGPRWEHETESEHSEHAECEHGHCEHAQGEHGQGEHGQGEHK